MSKLLALLLLFPLSATAASPEVCFTPGGDCTSIVVRELSKAKATVLVQAYSFTSAPIEKALVDAAKRGVKVQVLLDLSNVGYKYSGSHVLEAGKVPYLIDAVHAIAHNKVMVIDGKVVITGSFNFTSAAQKKNAENLVVIRDAAVAKLYADNWATHQQHAKPEAEVPPPKPAPHFSTPPAPTPAPTPSH